MSRIFIHLEGGLIQDVCSDVPDLEVVILDFDIEGADEDETIRHPDDAKDEVVYSLQTAGPLWPSVPGWLQAIRDDEQS